MDSSPDSGPIMTSALSCSIRRLVSLMAVSAWSLEHPMPASTSGWPLMAPPVQPSRGLFGFFGRAPANCDIAETTPARSWLSKDPNAPWQSDSTPILIGVPLPPDRGATAGCGSGQLTCACWLLSGVLVAFDDESDFFDELLSLLEPHPAAAKATVTAAAATQTGRPRAPMRFDMSFSSPPGAFPRAENVFNWSLVHA